MSQEMLVDTYKHNLQTNILINMGAIESKNVKDLVK